MKPIFSLARKAPKRVVLAEGEEAAYCTRLRS
jgi:phosphotransacetylase